MVDGSTGVEYIQINKRREQMKLVVQNGQIAIWEIAESYGSDFYVYVGEKLIRVCPSLGMARDVAASY